MNTASMSDVKLALGPSRLKSGNLRMWVSAVEVQGAPQCVFLPRRLTLLQGPMHDPAASAAPHILGHCSNCTHTYFAAAAAAAV